MIKHVASGMKLCSGCQHASTPSSKAASNEKTDSHSDPDFGSDFVSVNTETVCSVTAAAGGTPVKVTKYPVGRRKTYLQAKLKRSMDQLDKSVNSDSDEDVCSSKKNKNQNNDDLDTLMYHLKEKIAGSTSKKQISLLTLVPDSWSITRTEQFFKVHHLHILI